MTSMKNVIVLLADGFEEMEAVLPIDLMRRAGIFVQTVSMNNSLRVVGSRNIVIEADLLSDNIDDHYIQNTFPDAVFCPGGLNGSINLSKHPLTKKLLQTAKKNNGIIASMCACPPIVLGPLGLLDGKNFTCYPGMQNETHYAPLADLSGYKTDSVVVDGNLITSQGPGTASALAFTLIELLLDSETSKKVKEGALFF